MQRPGSLAGLPRAAAGIGVLWLLLIVPARPSELGAAELLGLPLELPVIVLALLLPLGPARRPLRAALAVLLVAGAVSRLADLGAQAAFGRPFNPVLDAGLVPAALGLVAGSLGTVPTALLCLAAAALILAAGLAAYRATGAISALAPAGRTARLAVAGLCLLAVLPPALDLAGRPLPVGTARATRLAAEEVATTRAARADLARFRIEARADPFATASPATLLGGLRGHDVYILFVESYGRTALDNPAYATPIRTTLTAGTAGLAKAGLAARSGWLEAPMTGGQSWFAHGTLLSGLRIDSQPRYDALMASPRLTLGRLAQRAGWQSVAVMPAITRAWPEAAYFGYDTVLAAADLGYRGKSFNWVTMPDQFTLAAFERRVLDPSPRPPAFAEIALISSHAPWTPIPTLLPWDAIGDGTVYDAVATSGEPPELLWRDTARVRTHYRDALDYALQAVLAFATRRGDTAPLLVVLGDHQPAALVSDGIGGRDVPVHLIGPPELVARAAAWGWTPGLVPDATVPTWPMDAFRDRFLAAFAGD